MAHEMGHPILFAAASLLPIASHSRAFRRVHVQRVRGGIRTSISSRSVVGARVAGTAEVAGSVEG
eukprot:7389883-Prymnesium_polylepis.1